MKPRIPFLARSTGSRLFVTHSFVRAVLLALAGVAVTSTGLQADELKLKDGTKISGTIVGFEENSFRVKTNYGFAVVQKDQVLSISISDSAKKAEEEKKTDSEKNLDAEKKADAASEKSRSKTAATDDASPATTLANGTAPSKVAKNDNASTSAAPAPTAAAAKPSATHASPSGPVVTKNVAAPAPSTSVAANTAPPPPPATKPETPEVIHEEVSGNTYTNDTYGFHMYKPPDWQVIDGARTLLPGAITAMGTADQTTYLLIGQEPASKPLVASMDATDKRLREVMENFRPLGDKHVTVAGTDAVERHFRGSVDQHDWSGVVAIIPHGTRVYTIFGMTYADTDLVQIQENVISRAISSLQFTQQ
jgi:hypothetical protein